MTVTVREWFSLLALIALCLTVGGVGGYVTAQSVAEWYPTLAKPSWNPPSWVFAPVWTALYVLMAVAAWLVWRKDQRFAGVRLALILFFVQLFFNFLWSLIFFGLRQPGFAFLDIALLWITLALTVWAFLGVSRLAGALMIPYLAWVSFASVLNFTIWRMN